MKSKQFYIA